MIFFSPASAFRLYMRYYALDAASRASFVRLVSLAGSLFKGLVLLFVLSPALLLTFQYVRKNVTCFGDTFFLLLGITSLYGLVFFIVFYTKPLTLSSQAVFLSAFWFFANGTWLPGWITLFFLLFSLLTLILILASANRIFSGDLVLLSRKRAMKNSIEDLNRNLKDVFHSEKNLMFSILILANEGPGRLRHTGRAGKAGAPERRRADEDGHDHRLPEPDPGAAPSYGADGYPRPARPGLEPCPARSIRIEKHFCNESVLCMVDEYHTRNALKNIFVNAVDALQLAQREDKRSPSTWTPAGPGSACPSATMGPGSPRGRFGASCCPLSPANPRIPTGASACPTPSG